MHAVAYENVFLLSSWLLDRLAAIGHLHSDRLFFVYHWHKAFISVTIRVTFTWCQNNSRICNLRFLYNRVTVTDNFTEMQKTYFKNPVPAVGVTVHGLIREIEYEVSESVR